MVDKNVAYYGVQDCGGLRQLQRRARVLVPHSHRPLDEFPQAAQQGRLQTSETNRFS